MKRLLVHVSSAALFLAAPSAFAAQGSSFAPTATGTTAGTFAAGNDPRVIAGGTAVQPGTPVDTNTRVSVNGTIARKLASAAADRVSALEFAKCDGSDETAAWSDVASAAVIRSVFIPAGYTCVTQTFAPSVSGFSITGDGDTSVLKQVAGASGALFAPTAAAFAANMKFDGNGSAQSSANDVVSITTTGNLANVLIFSAKGRGLVFSGTSDGANNTYSNVLNVRVTGSGSHGVYFANASNINFVDVLSSGNGGSGIRDFASSVGGNQRITLVGGAYNFNAGSGGDFEAATASDSFLDPTQYYTIYLNVVGVEFRGNTYYGALNSANTASWISNRFLSNGVPATLSNYTRQAFVAQSDNLTFDANLVDGAGGDGIDLGGVHNCSVTGNTVRHVNAYAIEVNSAQQCTILGNYAEDADRSNGTVTFTYAGIIQAKDTGSLTMARRLAPIANTINGNVLAYSSNEAYGIYSDANSISGVVSNNIALGWGATLRGINLNTASVVGYGNVTDDFPNGFYSTTQMVVKTSAPAINTTATVSGRTTSLNMSDGYNGQLVGPSGGNLYITPNTTSPGNIGLGGTSAAYPVTSVREHGFLAAEDHALSTVTTSFTYDATMHNIVAGSRATALTAPVVATLPACVTAIKNRTYGLKKVDTSTNAVTLTAATTNAQTSTADMIDGAATVALTAQNAQVNVECDGAGNWWRGFY